MALATPALSADLKYKPGEGPFNWQNFEDLKKNDLKGETLIISGLGAATMKPMCRWCSKISAQATGAEVKYSSSETTSSRP